MFSNLRQDADYRRCTAHMPVIAVNVNGTSPKVGDFYYNSPLPRMGIFSGHSNGVDRSYGYVVPGEVLDCFFGSHFGQHFLYSLINRLPVLASLVTGGKAGILEASKAELVATACPFCNIMLDDARKMKGKEDEVDVKDIAELVAEAL